MMITLEQIAIAKRYVRLIPDEPRNQPVEAVNPALAEIYREVFRLHEPAPDCVTEQEAIQQLDKELIP
jgi:hypothetical protein